MWTSTQPACTQSACPAPPPQVYGQPEGCDAPFVYGCVCRFVCDEGYQLPPHGVASLQCIVKKTVTNDTDVLDWDQSPTPCTARVCGAPPPQAHGGPDDCAPPYHLGSECLYECDAGWDMPSMTPPLILYCVFTPGGGGTLQWDADPMPCTEMMCGAPLPPLHGRPTRCPEPFMLGVMCEFECDVGYRLPVNGISLLECAASLRTKHSDPELVWSELATPCVLNECPALSTPDDAYPPLCTAANLYGSVCNVRCLTGFEGDSEHVCQADSTWLPSLAACTVRQCGPHHDQQNGQVVTCPIPPVFHTRCHYACHPGYQLAERGTAVVQCVSRATGAGTAIGWDRQPSPCVEQQCSTPKPQPNGHLVVCSNGFKFRSRCMFTCNDHFELPHNGVHFITCALPVSGGEHVEWDDVPSACLARPPPPVDCDPLVVPLHTVSSCGAGSVKAGAVCVLRCQHGYDRDANDTDTAQCDSHGRWDTLSTPCQVVTCAALDAVDNGLEPQCTHRVMWQSTCTFLCRPGYSMLPPNHSGVTCQSDGSWSQTLPQCNREPCPHAPPPGAHTYTDSDCTADRLFGALCSYRCDVGFIFIQPHGDTQFTVECVLFADVGGSHLAWDGVPQRCIKRTCPPPKSPSHGYLAGCSDAFRHLSSCSFTCDVGYEMTSSGTSVTTCVVSGDVMAWSADTGDCQSIRRCPLLPPTLTAVVQRCSDHRDYHSLCSLACLRGHHQAAGGSNFIFCRADGTWHRKPNKCVVNTCDEPLTAVNHIPLGCSDGYNYMSECWFGCQSGYHLPEAGVSRTTCVLSGVATHIFMAWDSLITDCSPNTCPAAPPALNAASDCCGRLHAAGSTCSYHCQGGYHHPGATDTPLTCLTNGSWSALPLHCLEVTCPAPPVVTSALLDPDCAPPYPVGSSCVYSCEERHHLLCGQQMSTHCRADGTWSDIAAVCLVDECPLVVPHDSLTNTHVVQCGSPRVYKALCVLACDEGFHPSPFRAFNIIHCLLNHRWSENQLVCERDECPPPALPPLTTAAVCSHHHHYGSQCQFSCVTGHHVDRRVTTTCLSGRLWSTPNGTACPANQCPPLPLPLQGTVLNCTQRTSYGSQCRSACSKGYQLTTAVEHVVSCLQNHTWAGELASCSNIDECASNPCPQDVRCIDKVDGYICQCPFSTHGLHCETNLCKCCSEDVAADDVNGDDDHCPPK